MCDKVLIIGASGRLGSVLSTRLAARLPTVMLGHKDLDLASPAAIDGALLPLDFTHVIITAALTAVDYCENNRDEAFAVNAEAPGRIADIAARKGAHVTYISTDMVFDGMKSGAYDEADRANPLSVYGKSKLEGEHRVLDACPGNLVARVSWVFGPNRPAFPEWIIQQSREQPEISLPGDKSGNPTFTMDLIEWLDALVFGIPEKPAGGIYHLCNSNACTWRDWGQLCIDAASAAGIPLLAGEIRGVPRASVAAFVARRPPNSALNTRKFTRATGIRPRSWQEATREHVSQQAGTIP